MGRQDLRLRRASPHLLEHRGIRPDRPGPRAPGRTGTRPCNNGHVRQQRLELPWPARLQRGRNTITGRAWSGAGAISHVEYSIDGAGWQPARLTGPNIPGALTRFELDWEARPEEHEKVTGNRREGQHPAVQCPVQRARLCLQRRRRSSSSYQRLVVSFQLVGFGNRWLLTGPHSCGPNLSTGRHKTRYRSQRRPSKYPARTPR